MKSDAHCLHHRHPSLLKSTGPLYVKCRWCGYRPSKVFYLSLDGFCSDYHRTLQHAAPSAWL